MDNLLAKLTNGIICKIWADTCRQARVSSQSPTYLEGSRNAAKDNIFHKTNNKMVPSYLLLNKYGPNFVMKPVKRMEYANGVKVVVNGKNILARPNQKKIKDLNEKIRARDWDAARIRV